MKERFVKNFLSETPSYKNCYTMLRDKVKDIRHLKTSTSNF